MQQTLLKQQSTNSNYDIEDYNKDDYDEELIMSNQGSEDKQQKTGIKILTQDLVYDSLQLQLNDLMEVIPLSFDALLEIFHQYGWNKDKLMEQYFESDQKQNKIILPLKQQGIIIDKQLIIQKSHLLKQCPICFEDMNQTNPSSYLQCGHQFCQNCWINFINEKSVANKVAFLTCMMNGCLFRIPFSFIKQVTQPAQKIFLGHIKSLCLGYINGNKQLAWCPGVDCKYCIQVTDVSSKQVHCPCGEIFCFRCRDEIHVPAPCDMVQKWLGEVKRDEANIKWILVNTKICPFCRRPVERSDGCNFMTCRPPGGCGGNFCYICSKPWEPTHVDHFKCNVYVVDNAQEQLKSKEKLFLEKYNFYFERWLNSEGAKKKSQERKLKLPHIIQIIFQYIQVTFHDSQFLEVAIKELIESRTALKWSYCFAYYMSTSHSQSTQLFLHYQQLFEVACEKLAIEMIEMFTFVEEIENSKAKKDNCHEFFQNFSTRKIKIQSYMITCNKYKQNLVDTVNSGEIFVEQT